MKKTIFFIFFILQISILISQEKSNISSTLGFSKTNFSQSKKNNIPFISTTYSHSIFQNFYLGCEISFGILNQFNFNEFNSYNFQDYEIKVIYNKTLNKRFFLSSNINFGSNFYFSSEIIKQANFTTTKSEILTITFFLSPELKIHYLLNNNFYLGLTYQHKFFFDNVNSPDFGISFGLMF